MSTPGSLQRCPQCGGELPADAPAGLCPRCVMALNFGPETQLPDDDTAHHPPLSADDIAPHFPQLEILGLLGRGGMGVVYQARQRSLNRLVALKLLAPERVGDPDFSARFACEAQALAKLTHPGIVAVHDFGQAGGFFYLLMEFVDGVNLRRALSARHFTPEQALAMVPPICDALQFAHERGIVHRDIKPENLLLDRAGRVKIADFGIAKMLGAETEAAEENAVGTPGYMAPEQRATPSRADHRADIYSLGVVIYEMLTGELPARHLEPPSRKVQVDVRLDEIVLRALEKEPELRFQTAAELRTEAENAASSPPRPAPFAWQRRWLALPLPARRSMSIAAVLAALVLLAIFLLPRTSFEPAQDGEQEIRRWGLLDPWLVERDGFGPRDGRSHELHVGSVSFVAGLGVLLFMAAFGATQRAELHAEPGRSLRLRLVELRHGRREISGPALGLLILVMQITALAALGLLHAAMTIGGSAPPLSLSLAFTVSAVFLVAVAFVFAELLGWRMQPARSPRHGLFHYASLLLALGVAALGYYFISRPPSRAIPKVLPAQTKTGSPQQIDFHLSRVEVPEGTRKIFVHFERDDRPGLGLELTQDVTRSPADTGPKSSYRKADETIWVGPRDPRVLTWTLPADFSEDEVRAVAKALESRAQQFRQMPEGAVIEFATARHRDGWSYHLLARVKGEPEVSPAPDQPDPDPPAGAAFTFEKQVAVPQESRVSVEIFQTVNDGTRSPLEAPLTFKTALGSGLGVLLRWYGYGPEHPTHAHRWILDLIDPQNGTIFHRIEGDFDTAVQLNPLDGAPSGEGTPATIDAAGSQVILRLLSAKRIEPPGAPVLVWWEVQAIVTLRAANQDSDPPQFQLPASPSPHIAAPTNSDHAALAHDSAAGVKNITDAPQWLPGKWIFDLDYTNQQLAEAEKDKSRGGLGDLANALVVPQLIGALEGSKIAVTGKNFAMTTKDGNGKAYTYEVLEIADPSTATLKMDDGEINTLHHEGKRFWMTSTGTVNIKVYFRRQEPVGEE